MLDTAKDDLINLFRESDVDVRATAVLIMKKLKDPMVLPHLISLAESDPNGDIRSIAKDASREIIEGSLS